MKSYNAKHVSVLSNRGFYTVLILCGLIIAGSVWVLWNNAQQEESASAPVTPVITPAENNVPDLSEDTPVSAQTTQPEAEPEEPTEPEESTETPSASSSAPEADVTVSAPVYVRPVSGAVITPFSGDELLFQPTLGDWRVHTGTDFAAEAGESVQSITDGTVQQVYEDGLYGTCVTVAHDADLATTYCGLTDVRVSEGQSVAAGETLGAVAETIDAEATLGTHLHVEAARAGTAVDVQELIGESEAE